MEKIIKIYLSSQEEVVEKYHGEKIASEIVDYILKEAMFVTKKEKIKIIINKDHSIKQECMKLLMDGFYQEYEMSKKIYHITNIKQIFLLIIGVIFLFLSTIVKENIIWKEILLIGGWVPIWETIDLELFSDSQERRKRKILKKLLKSEIIERIENR